MTFTAQNNLWLPPPDLSISEWADEYRYLSRESSAEPGKWKTDRAPYQREMMNAVKNSERVVMMTSAQVGKSEILLNVIGYHIQLDPAPILVLQPTLEMGETFSKDRLAPMIRDTPVLTDKIADPKSRTSGNTLLHKNFPGGHVTIAGANSPAGLASRPIRILLCDEVDRYPVSAGTEGDPLTLAMKRTANFWNRRIILVSTPTIKTISRIETAYELSTREDWEVPCPNCGTYQPYSWHQISYKDRTCPVMKCIHCGKEYPSSYWHKGTGKWIAHAESQTRGFHVNAFASPWVTWEDIVKQYHEAFFVGEEMLKVWTNTVLGEPYEIKDGAIEIAGLQTHCEDYGAEVPQDVLILTCGIDTQDDRLELEVLGWGLHKESWGIEYKILYGDPGQPELWEELDKFLSRTWSKADGQELAISCACIDSAGHFTDSVYKFCKGKSKRKIFAIVGRGKYGMPSVSKPNRNNRMRLPLFTLGVSTIKGVLHSRLQAEPNKGGYCHFPRDIKKGYDDLYFKGLLSERMVIKRVKGQDRVTWEVVNEHVRNEPLDCRVYAIGAYEILNPDLTKHKTPGVSQPERKNIQAPAKTTRPRRKLTIRRGFAL